MTAPVEAKVGDPSHSGARPRVYLAGPDVFLPNAREIGARKVAICAELGLAGVFPLDGEIEIDGLTAFEQARRIALGNEALMRSCQAVIANLTPFRGASMDAGTAFEVGYMRALGRPLFGYTNTASDYADRAWAARSQGLIAGDFDLDGEASGIEIEDFGLAENLMIAIAIAETECSGGFGVVSNESAPEAAATDLVGFEKACRIAASHLLGRPAR